MTEELQHATARLSPARAELLRRWRYGRGVARAEAAGDIPRRSANGPAVLSFAQERLWVLEQLLGPGNSYNTIPLAARLTGPLEVDVLTRSLRHVVARHEVMRSRFPVIDGQARQVVEAEVPVDVRVVDLRAEPDPEAEAFRRATAARATPFDLATGPLFTTQLFRLSDQEHFLLHLTHHIISDGWSDDVLIREVAAGYLAFAEGHEPSLAPLRIQFADYATWQRDRLRGRSLEDLLAYWRDRLADAPTVLDLPTDNPRPATQRFLGATCPLWIPAEVTSGLKLLAKAEDATLFMTLLAAVSVLLGRYSGQREVLIGSPVANRTEPVTEDLIGCFINTLVFRTDLRGDPTFRDLLGAVRATALGAYAHQELPFERLVDELQPGRDTSRHPLFQVMLALQNSPPEALEFGAYRLAPIEMDNGVAKFDITIDLREYDGALTGRVQFDRDLFGDATRDRMTTHLGNLLAAVAEDADRRLSELPMLNGAELDRMLFGWNDTAVDRRAECLHELIERQAVDHSAAIAVSAPDGQLTYQELDRQADRLARELRGLGVGQDTPVGLLVERSVYLPIGILGILKAGGGYVPLDPRYPAGRLADMITDARLPVIVTMSSLTDVLTAYRGHVVCVDRAHGGRSTSRPVAATIPDCLAYVIYTSGSTGKPKGAMISHRAVANMITSTLAGTGIGVGDSVLQFATVCFDVSVLEIFAALCSGGRLVIPDQETLLDPEGLTELMVREQVTVFDIPPAVLELLSPDSIPSLRVQFIGCEAFGGELATRWQRPHRRLINGYGPTEATVMMTLMELDQPYHRMPPIGRPMPNHQIYVLDSYGSPVPAGTPGELYIGGAGLARGYLGRPGMTAGKFVPDPFGRQPGARLYRTGDLVRYQPDGTLDFVGRADQQVKIRGLRIELGEIESVLGEHPEAGHAVAAVHEPAGGAKQLVAYVQLDRITSHSAGELRTWLVDRLPTHLLPQVIIPVERFPLTSSGKVDRAGLPDPAAALDAIASTGEQLGSAVERTLGDEIFAEILGVDRVGPHSSFFQLGGSSLQLAVLQARISERFGLQVPLKVLFEGPSVGQLARYLGDQGIEAEPVGGRAERTRPAQVPLTWQQQRVWSRRWSYNKPLAARLKGWLDPGAVQAAVHRLADRHEMLRTVFDTDGPEVRQVISTSVRPEFAVIDVPDMDGAMRIVADEVHHEFDLRDGSLARVLLLRLDDFEHVLVATLHPLLWDGGSRGIFARDLLVLGELAEGDLPPMISQYSDYAVWEEEQRAGREYTRSARYWADRLAGSSRLLLPGRLGGEPGGAGAQHRLELPSGVINAVTAFARAENATPHNVLLTAFMLALRQFTAETDIVVGVPLANRVHPGATEVIGQFVNTVPLRVVFGDDRSFRSALRRVRTAMAEASEHQHSPPPEAGMPRITFDLMEVAGELPEAVGVELIPVEVDTGHADFELTLAVERRADGLHALMRYDTEVHPADTVRRLTDVCTAILLETINGG
ncbi:non-ribosomal peptide synthetase [Amycolatopsis magusensis]|uniref:Amino acid adenylation domain-containing protein n=1 Tax=Amycolatopsis magusensis TaxID=882444 RepID=A0ABS4PU43_9PSEU|nr:non-ribosomal peptide synthetase [Amycolatopsis magusensis]MBP2182952.1 amino acid adenylation domain-containing protein [Amycolatopsis magusensis]